MRGQLKLSLKLILKVGYFLPLTIFGLMHFALPEEFRDLVPVFVPGGIFWVYFSGAALSLSGLAIMLNIVPKTTAVCLLLFVLTFILTVDLPGVLIGMEKHKFFISLLKDFSLLSGTGLFLLLMQPRFVVVD